MEISINENGNLMNRIVPEILKFLCFLIVICVSFPLHASVNGIEQERNPKQVEVKGKIIDDMGEPLPGVNVIVVGSPRGVATDIDGSFSISVLPTDKLNVSYLGMEDQVVSIGSKRNLTIVMKPKTDELEEVTVVAFAKQKKESVLASVSTIKPSELKVPSSNLTTALAGRVSGLISYQRSGEPGQLQAVL